MYWYVVAFWTYLSFSFSLFAMVRFAAGRSTALAQPAISSPSSLAARSIKTR